VAVVELTLAVAQQEQVVLEVVATPELLLEVTDRLHLQILVAAAVALQQVPQHRQRH
jgi:hypothetical protein